MFLTGSHYQSAQHIFTS